MDWWLQPRWTLLFTNGASFRRAKPVPPFTLTPHSQVAKQAQCCHSPPYGSPDGEVIGSTRFFNIEHWGWPRNHARHGLPDPDVCEIGYTWLTRSAIRTAANTEAKLLMLAYAFETWRGAGRLPAHRCAQSALAGSNRAYRGQIGWSSARSPDGCGFYAAGFCAFFDSSGGMARSEGAPHGVP